MNTAYLLLGSNLGDRESYLSRAIELLETRAGEIFARSALYRTSPWPEPDAGSPAKQGDFLNQAIGLKTKLSADALLATLLSVEEKIGRKREQKWEARIIDIDILFFNSDVIQLPDLRVPHPFVHERRFALTPLAEIARDFNHPIIQKTVVQMLADIRDNLKVTIHKK